MSNGKKNLWKWKPKKWWVTLIIFWFLSVTTTEFVDPEIVGPLIKIYMLIIVIYSVTEDIRFNETWKKILWVLGMWLLQAILMIPIVFTIGPFLIKQGEIVFERGINTLSALPILIWSMRKSKHFVNFTNKVLNNEIESS